MYRCEYIWDIEYRSDDVTKTFLFAFQCFEYYKSVEHDEKPQNLVEMAWFQTYEPGQYFNGAPMRRFM